MSQALLSIVGSRIRDIRESRGLSRRALSELSGVSERFLAQVETGKGNISLTRFVEVARALHTEPSTILAQILKRSTKTIALLGVRGAGKSTVGELLAARLGGEFVEVDREIARSAGLTLSQIFDVHGESYYRKLESEVLRHQLSRDTLLVLATGGSIVNHEENFELLKMHADTLWLKASADDHWSRVIKQGDKRPMQKNPHAFSELRALLETREIQYKRADHTVDTHDKSVVEVVDAALALVSGD